MKKQIALVLAVAAAACPQLARAGGFEFPDNGTEALGRGAAFTAKADDATAIEYNIAGLARQRGWRLMFDSNLVWHTYDFQRAGSYPSSQMAVPDPNKPGDRMLVPAPYGGQPFPKVSNHAGIFYAPFVGLSTDFGILDRWTFAIGLYGPSSVGKRDFGTSITLPGGINAPTPSRYDVTNVDLLLAFPTLAAAFRATRWLDIGVALQLVYATFDVANASYLDLSNTSCLSAEDAACDSITRIRASTVTATASAGLMFHPVRGLHVGVNLRPEVSVDATGGTADGSSPPALSLSGSGFVIPQGHGVEFHTKLPWVARLGVRYAFEDADEFEHGDIEVDGTYEAWHHAEGNGDHIYIPDLQPLSDVHADITHHYQDTYSIRVGGAYNVRAGRAAVLSFRLGAFYDSSATKPKDTRADFDTMEKVGATAGLGATVRGITLNFAYAYLWEPDRTVTDGNIVDISPLTGARSTVINNGKYHASNQVVSIGLTVAWAELVGQKRVIRWK